MDARAAQFGTLAAKSSERRVAVAEQVVLRFSRSECCLALSLALLLLLQLLSLL